jgi:hypothetical protein
MLIPETYDILRALAVYIFTVVLHLHNVLQYCTVLYEQENFEKGHFRYWDIGNHKARM